MPLFSRRKSDTNLQSASERIPRSASGRVGLSGSETDGRKGRRSKSTTRESRETRPERDVPPVPSKESSYSGSGLGNWNSETNLRQTSSSNLPPGAMPSRPPSAQYYQAATISTPPSTRRPARQSSLGASSASHDSSFSSATTKLASTVSPSIPPRNFEHHKSPSMSSPSSLPGQPRPFEHLPIVSPSSRIHTNSQQFHTPPRRSSRQDFSNPPLSSSAKFARSMSLSPPTAAGGVDYTSVADSVVGLAPSSSFYGGTFASNGHSLQSTPSQSPTTSPRSSQLAELQSSLTQRTLQNSHEDSPSMRRSTLKREDLPSPPPFAPPKLRDNSSSTPSAGASTRSPSSSTLYSSPTTNSLLATSYGTTPPSSRFSVTRNQSNQSTVDKSSSTSEEDGAVTENTSIDGFTPPSKQSQFELAPSLPINDTHPSPPIDSFEPLPVDTTPPRTAPALPSTPRDKTETSSMTRAENDSLHDSTHHPRQLHDGVGSATIAPVSSSLPAAKSSENRSSILQSASSSISNANRPLKPSAPSTPPPLSPQFQARDPSPSPRRVSAKLIASPTRAAALAAAREREKRALAGNSLPKKEEEEHRREEFTEKDSRKEEEETVSVAEKVVKNRVRSRMEVAFSLCSRQILKVILPFLSDQEVVSLRATSKTLRLALDTDGRELILERFLGAQGYRSYLPRSDKRQTFLPSDDLISLDLRDLSVFRAAQSMTLDDYSRFSKAYNAGQLPPSKLKLARATTRSWNRVVLRLRSQTILPSAMFAPSSFPDLRQVKQPVYKSPRAPQLRVWVPTSRGDSWMNDQEIVECERELWRSGKGVWSELRKGDIVTNVAIEAFGNCGRTIFDGRFLRDLSFDFDVIGHLPSWLNMLTLSPSYFHNILASSTSNPVFYLSLSPFVQRLQETLRLESEKVSLSSPQGNYQVKRHVYRGMIEIKAGRVLESTTADGGFEVCHPEWAGKLAFETEGTAEHASLLIARVASKAPTPWKVLRERCRPGRLHLSPVLEK